MGVFTGFSILLYLFVPVWKVLQCAHLGSNQGPKDYESSTLTD